MTFMFITNFHICYSLVMKLYIRQPRYELLHQHHYAFIPQNLLQFNWLESVSSFYVNLLMFMSHVLPACYAHIHAFLSAYEAVHNKYRRNSCSKYSQTVEKFVIKAQPTSVLAKLHNLLRYFTISAVNYLLQNVPVKLTFKSGYLC